MMWRTGCINKLPYSKLSTVTEPKGLAGGGGLGGGGFSVGTISTSSFL